MFDLTFYFDSRMVLNPDLARAERPNAPFRAPMGLCLVVRSAFCGPNPDFGTDYALNGRSRRLRTRYRLANAQVTKSLWAFFSRPR